MLESYLESITLIKVKTSNITAKEECLRFFFFTNKLKYNIYKLHASYRLMSLTSKIEYLILPKGMKFTGSGKLGLIKHESLVKIEAYF